MTRPVVRCDGYSELGSRGDGEERQVCGSGVRQKESMGIETRTMAVDDMDAITVAKTAGCEAAVLVKAASLRPTNLIAGGVAS